jgi:YHS domain-containing protein
LQYLYYLIHKKQKAPAKLNVKVVNEEDPICGMKTAQFLKDTLTYNKKLYGFCGTHCKEAFKKEPKKYIKK